MSCFHTRGTHRSQVRNRPRNRGTVPPARGAVSWIERSPTPRSQPSNVFSERAKETWFPPRPRQRCRRGANWKKSVNTCRDRLLGVTKALQVLNRSAARQDRGRSYGLPGTAPANEPAWYLVIVRRRRSLPSRRPTILAWPDRARHTLPSTNRGNFTLTGWCL